MNDKYNNIFRKSKAFKERGVHPDIVELRFQHYQERYNSKIEYFCEFLLYSVYGIFFRSFFVIIFFVIFCTLSIFR